MQFRHPWGGLADPAWSLGADLTILGVPYDGAACFRAGAAQAPSRLRAISTSSPAISEEGYVVDPVRFQVRDAGDVSAPVDGSGQPDGSEGARTPTSSACRKRQGRRCSRRSCSRWAEITRSPSPSAAPSRGSHPEGFGLVLLDAHPDLFDTYEGSKTSHACPMRRALETGALAPQHLLILGTRSYNAVELDFMKEAGIRFVPARELQRMGMDAAVKLAQQQLAGLRSVYLTIDIDVADPACAPGTGAPVAGGLSSRQLLDLARGLVEALPVRAMDIVEVAPPLDPADITLFLALQVVFETFAVLARKKG